jgi:hypothetical protein
MNLCSKIFCGDTEIPSFWKKILGERKPGVIKREQPYKATPSPYIRTKKLKILKFLDTENVKPFSE